MLLEDVVFYLVYLQLIELGIKIWCCALCVLTSQFGATAKEKDLIVI